MLIWTRGLSCYYRTRSLDHLSTDEVILDIPRSFIIPCPDCLIEECTDQLDEVLEKSDLVGGIFLNRTLSSRLTQTYTVLIDEAHVNLNGF